MIDLDFKFNLVFFSFQAYRKITCSVDTLEDAMHLSPGGGVTWPRPPSRKDLQHDAGGGI